MPGRPTNISIQRVSAADVDAAEAVEEVLAEVEAEEQVTQVAAALRRLTLNYHTFPVGAPGLASVGGHRGLALCYPTDTFWRQDLL